MEIVLVDLNIYRFKCMFKFWTFSLEKTSRLIFIEGILY